MLEVMIDWISNMAGLGHEITRSDWLRLTTSPTHSIPIRDPSDAITLQQEIDKCKRWASTNDFNINNSKCNYISFARGPLTLQSTYRLYRQHVSEEG